MKITTLSEVIERFYYSGRVKITNRELSRRDFLQFVKISWGFLMRQMYYDSKKMNDGDEYYFFSGDLLKLTFKLGEPDCRGMRRVDMSDFDLFRLPKNSHIQNVYPVNKKGCDLYEITQVQPSEENFYIGDPQMKFFKFYSVRGKGLNTYNLPPCTDDVEVESIFDSDELDVSMDMAFDIFNHVFGTALKIKGFPINPQDDSYDPQARTIKQALAQEPQLK